MTARVYIGLDLANGPDRSVMRCGCGGPLEIASGNQLLIAARMTMAVRPTNWDDEEDPDVVAAWSALEEALMAFGGSKP